MNQPRCLLISIRKRSLSENKASFGSFQDNLGLGFETTSAHVQTRRGMGGGGACLHFESLFLYFINTFVSLASSCTKSSSKIVRQKGSNSLLRSASHLPSHLQSVFQPRNKPRFEASRQTRPLVRAPHIPMSPDLWDEHQRRDETPRPYPHTITS